jgi:hypothetical protein
MLGESQRQGNLRKSRGNILLRSPPAALPAESLTQIGFTLHHACPGSLLTRNYQDALAQRHGKSIPSS